MSHEINQLRAEHEALVKVFVVAARLRQFPVPFDDHGALVDAVDQCRSIIEPSAPESPARYTREEFLAMFRQAHATLHHLWTAAVGKEDYDKSLWRVLDNALARFARDAAETAGIGRTESLL